MGKPAHILVVEDDTTMRELLHSYLVRQGYEVTEACNSDVALPILQSEQHIDLLLTDVVMPGARDGFALSREARRLRPGLKVLHVTGYSDRLKSHAGMVQSGRLMQKPVDRTALLDRVGQLLASWAVDQNDLLRRAYDYWVEKAKGRPMPERSELDPAEIKDLLPDISIIEAAGEPRRYRCRLTGTRIVEAMGFNPTNRFIDEAFDTDDAEFLKTLLDEVTARGQPLYAASAFRSTDCGMSTERLLLPFAVASGGAPQIVIVQTIDWAQRASTFHDIAQRRPQRTDSVQRPQI